MPSKSTKQAKFMRAISHSPKFAKKVGVPQSVGKEYEMADKKTKKFRGGGSAPDYPIRIDFRDKKPVPAKRTPKEEGEKQYMEKKYPFNKYASGGSPMKKASKSGRAMVNNSADAKGRAMVKMAKGGSIDGVAKKGKTKGKQIKMAMGGPAGMPAQAMGAGRPTSMPAQAATGLNRAAAIRGRPFNRGGKAKGTC